MRVLKVLMKMPLARWSKMLVIAVLVSGCFRLPTFAPQGQVLSQAESTELCEALPTLTREGPYAFRALLDTTLVTTDRESFSFRYAVASKQPERLRVDLLPAEGAYTLGLLVVSNAGSLVIDSQAKTFASGCDVNAVSERFFALQGVTPDLIQALVTGRISGVRCESVQAYRLGDGHLLLVDAVTQRAWDVDERSGRVGEVTLLDTSLARIQAQAVRSYAPQKEAIFVLSNCC